MGFETTEFHQSFKNGIIDGYAFSVTAVLIAYMVYSYFAPYTELEQKKIIHGNKFIELSRYVCSIICWQTQMVTYQIHEMLSLLLVKETKQINALLEKLTSTMRFEELGVATDFFTIDNAIGMGKMGIMYEGRLPNGSYIAVKKLEHSRMFKRQFLLGATILGKLRHTNIVPLLGFCIERKERILAYPYMSNGRLSKWLHPLDSEVVRLKWPERVKIAFGVARALSWLHHNCNLHVVHFNICSECILLDENFEPKISNFGGAKFMNRDMENDDLGMMFKVENGKKDVYDFGSVLFELITGKTLIELLSLSDTNNLWGNAKLSVFCDAIDKSLVGKGFENEICTLIKVAYNCVHPLPDQRPTMLEVYNYMSNNIWEGQNGISDDSDVARESEIVSFNRVEEIVGL